mgnify:CR=1 FL=1
MKGKGHNRGLHGVVRRDIMFQVLCRTTCSSLQCVWMVGWGGAGWVGGGVRAGRFPLVEQWLKCHKYGVCACETYCFTWKLE